MFSCNRIFFTVTLLVSIIFIYQNVNSQSKNSDQVIVEGQVFDSDTKLPIPHATVQVVGTGRSTLVNDDGYFRISLASNEFKLKISHIAYYSYHTELSKNENPIRLEVFLHTALIDIGSMKVYGRALDPGQRIIAEAIKRKEAILTKLKNYSFDAYVKLSVSDISKPDSSKMLLLTETHITSHWAYPDKYKEIVKAKTQTSNLNPDEILVTMGEILNFNKDRIDFGRYSIVSPTATDALDHYNYYLLDTVMIDSSRAFLLEIEPKNKDLPLFVGTIHIADSTYDVVGVDFGFTKGVDLPFYENLNYSQRYLLFEDEYWMPNEISFTGDLNIKVPIPGIPNSMSFSYIASMNSYLFEQDNIEEVFDEFILEVDEKADDYDSTEWQSFRTIPLTSKELAGCARIDSLENLPVPIQKKIIGITLGLGFTFLFGSMHDIYHFNRVEGYYLGAGHQLKLNKQLSVYVQGGYGFETKRAQQYHSLYWQLHKLQRIHFYLSYFDVISKRPSITSSGYNPSFGALAFGEDPSDYYRTEGIEFSLSSKLFDFSHIDLRLTYDDQLHYSVPLGTDHRIFPNDNIIRDNPEITEGKFRSVSASLSYDSRPMIKLKNHIARTGALQFTVLTLGIEYTKPDIFKTDFNFKRYYARLYRRQRTLGLGLTSISMYAGSSEGDLPPQRYFAFDYGNGYVANQLTFNTLSQSIFRGDRAFSIYFEHNFRRLLFVKSGIPIIKDIPFRFSVHGGLFWNEMRGNVASLNETQLTAWERPYKELGFGLSNLTPFMTPFNLALKFSWELSDYDSDRFNIALNMQL